MCTDEQHKELLKALEPRPPIGQSFQLSNTQGFFLDYKGRRHVYMFSTVSLTLGLNDLGNVDIPAKTFTDISFREGIQIFPTTQPTAVAVWVLATDDVLLDLPSNADGITVQTLTNQGPATVVSLTQVNPYFRGLMVVVNITAISGGGTLTVSIVGVDPVSGGTTVLLASAALNGTGKTFLFVYPGITTSNNVAASAAVPRSWAVSSLVAGGGTLVSATISAALEL